MTSSVEAYLALSVQNDANLAMIAAACPMLPAPVKAGVLAMVRASGDTSEAAEG